MRVGRAAAYAVFATVHLAERADGVPIQGKEIAESCGVPAGHLLKILQQLVRAQILSSERGPAGGFVLRRAPDDISLLEIIEAIEGPVSGDLLLRNIAREKEQARSRLERSCQDIATYAKDLLSRTRVSELIGQSTVHG